jgi:hypothetical protein
VGALTMHTGTGCSPLRNLRQHAVTVKDPAGSGRRAGYRPAAAVCRGHEGRLSVVCGQLYWQDRPSWEARDRSSTGLATTSGYEHSPAAARRQPAMPGAHIANYGARFRS